jgi:lipopolysaccharide biosynthesis protein
LPCHPSGPGFSLPNLYVPPITETYHTFTQVDPISKPFRTLAYYLPQYHPFEENDRFWGKGFTEWTNVAKAQPLFLGHYQPHYPVHLGYYDLRVVDNIAEQARLARQYSVDGFAIYMYWFNGRFVMDGPLRALLSNKHINISYCLLWANENWTRRWDGAENDVLLAQNHSLADSAKMLQQIMPFFDDKRYVRVNSSPVFMVYRPHVIPNIKETANMWRQLARENGHGGLYLIASQSFGLRDPGAVGFEAAAQFPPHHGSSKYPWHEIKDRLPGLNSSFSGKIYSYAQHIPGLYVEDWPSTYTTYGCSMMSWDNTARRGNKAQVYYEFTLRHFHRWNKLNGLRALANPHLPRDARFTFINAWNEWAEGTHLEPDRRYGFGYLRAVYEANKDFNDVADFTHTVLLKQHDPRVHGHAKQYCAIVHAYYMNATVDVLTRLSFFEQKADIYVSTDTIDKAQLVKRHLPSAIVSLHENRGRDILPFVETLSTILPLNYTACVKLHSKETIYLPKNTIRNELLDSLLPTPDILEARILQRFQGDTTLGALVPSDYKTPFTHINMKYSCRAVVDLWHDIAFQPDTSWQYVFAAGTMFWLRPAAFVWVKQLKSYNFPDECGHIDGTVAHAIERSVLLLVQQYNFTFDTI